MRDRLGWWMASTTARSQQLSAKGFIRQLMPVQRKVRPLHCVCVEQNKYCWRSGETSFLHQWLISLFFTIFPFHPFFFSPSLFLTPPPPPFPTSPPSALCCRFSLPVVVMPTSQETVLSWIPCSRADQLMSGVVQACAQIGLLYVRSLSQIFLASFFFCFFLDTSVHPFTSVCLFSTSHHPQLQWDHTDFVSKKSDKCVRVQPYHVILSK